MGYGGAGIVNVETLGEAGQHPAIPGLNFIPRRFQAGRELPITQGPVIQKVPNLTCCLCGAPILKGQKANDEHPLPQWLLAFADDSAEVRSWSFQHMPGSPKWSQLRLRSHQECNTQFDVKIERPIQSAVKAIADGRRDVTSVEIDKVFDWLDKIKSTSAHMGSALMGQRLVLGYDDISFPNFRVGAFDRFAFFFRLKDSRSRLELWNILHEGFLTSPAAICLQVKDLVIVYVSSNFLLSQAFGLGSLVRLGQRQLFIPGDSLFMNGFASRVTRLPSAKILAQPMRKCLESVGFFDQNKSLGPDGEGKIYELRNRHWERFKSSKFNDLPFINEPIGRNLAGLETVEWIIKAKEQDAQYYPNATKGIFMESMEEMHRERRGLSEIVSTLRERGW